MSCLQGRTALFALRVRFADVRRFGGVLVLYTVLLACFWAEAWNANAGLPSEFGLVKPRISHGGDRIVGFRDVYGHPEFTTNLFVITLADGAGSEKSLPTPVGPKSDAFWFPEGDAVGYLLRQPAPRGFKTAVFRYDLKTLSPTLLFEVPGGVFSPDLAKDGRRLLYSKEDGVAYDIYLYDLASKEESRITRTPAFDDLPRWCDGERFTYLMRDDTKSVVMEWDLTTGASKQRSPEGVDVHTYDLEDLADDGK